MGVRVGVQVLRGVAQLPRFPRLSQPQRDTRIQAWARGILKQFGIALEVVGHPAQKGPVLLVANHVSWLDIPALHAVCHCRFVAKADVARWPVVGALASGTGTMYVSRESRRDAMRVVHGMTEALRGGDILAVFPEGTTGDGSAVLPFRSSLIQAAIAADAPVQPVALKIVDGSSAEPSRAASYMGDESLLGSAWRTLRARDLRVVATFGTPRLNDGRDRHAWADELRAEIAALQQTSTR
jgi:1-acyl-sn-glycerol-3-phosphate acyltransferase